MPMGRLFAFLFFLSVLFACIMSLANMLEAVSEAAQTRSKLKRKTAVVLSGVATLAVGLLIEQEALMGRWMDIITIYVVPIGAILGAVMIYWVLGVKEIKKELMLGREKRSAVYLILSQNMFMFSWQRSSSYSAS